MEKSEFKTELVRNGGDTAVQAGASLKGCLRLEQWKKTQTALHHLHPD